jgi:choline dehydrogenase-like flavoprotein
MRELDIPIIVDSMGGDAIGAFLFTLSLDPQTETRSTSQGFYTPERPNLHLLTGYQVVRLLTASEDSAVRVTAVEYSSGVGAEIHQVLAEKEVILAAGALHTPQILQLSGIGDPDHLSTLGIKSVADLPGVGANYQDHPLFATAHISRSSHMCSVLVYCTKRFILS